MEQDYDEAMKWFRLAADQGDARGQANLGFMYAFGLGGAGGREEAIKWLRKAAEQGNSIAQVNLGSIYKLPPQDYVEAVKWLRLAAEQGDATAQLAIGVIYAYANQWVFAKGVPEDHVQAYMWLSLGASRFPASSKYYHSSDLDHVAAKMTSAEIAEAQRLAAEWKPK